MTEKIKSALLINNTQKGMDEITYDSGLCISLSSPTGRGTEFKPPKVWIRIPLGGP